MPGGLCCTNALSSLNSAAEIISAFKADFLAQYGHRLGDDHRRVLSAMANLFRHKALAKVFRAKMLAGFAVARIKLPARCRSQWVVDCKSVGSGEKALVYLGRYLFRGVVREKDIIACGNGQVSFRFHNARTGKAEVRTVSGAQLL